MKRFILFFFLAATFAAAWTQTRHSESSVYVDKKGVMRYADDHAEASFFGVNYTVPFAHAYRALGYLGVDHRAAIDKDVYHMARLGFNAYRIHVWDVEISDHDGNLLDNEHLALLDYLIYKLKERGIKTVITAMTNFGNGYPERNMPTGGFSYDYDKCEIHAHPQAIRAQQNYIAQLVRHVNPHTGVAYMNDADIVGFEINNEPCHTGSRKQTARYITDMVRALKKAGVKKPIFYNVSHNMDVVEAYYETPIQGTTYQWYPVGLVGGRTRTGNFLPAVDAYPISFDTVKGFANKARLIYEYDPADNLTAYIHPAMVRSFRKAGFQWITQFAYDPIDMAAYNTEYQTHYLNLAYTPRKAVSMKIAAEAAYGIARGADFGTYPADTLFADFSVSHTQDLSTLNTPHTYYYSNHTNVAPVAPELLATIAGWGNSPVVQYAGTGAYFLDRLEPGVWRLEVMPDAVEVSDPFAKPSLRKEVVRIAWGSWPMTIALPDLGSNFTARPLNTENTYVPAVQGTKLTGVRPGVYLLQSKTATPTRTWTATERMGNIAIGEFVAPPAHEGEYAVHHTPARVVEADRPYTITATISGSQAPDSVMVYTDRVSFWNPQNPYYKMKQTGPYTYAVDLPAHEIREDCFRYNIIVCRADAHTTFPAGTSGNPLDWDYTAYTYYEADVVAAGSTISLFDSRRRGDYLETYRMRGENTVFMRKDIAPLIAHRKHRLARATHLSVEVDAPATELSIGFVTTTGFTYKATVTLTPGKNLIDLSLLRQTKTALLPESFPSFLPTYFEPQVQLPFRIEDIEKLEISHPGEKRFLVLKFLSFLVL